MKSGTLLVPICQIKLLFNNGLVEPIVETLQLMVTDVSGVNKIIGKLYFLKLIKFIK